jgi:hypothetical protein
MKKGILLILFFCCAVLTTPLFSIDLGGTFDNATEFSTNEASGMYQIVRLRLWLSQGLGTHWNFSMAGNYTFELDYPYLFDIDDLSLKGSWPFIEEGPLLYSTAIGRYNLAEFSSQVLNHKVDGFQFQFHYPRSIISLGLGYTGLIAKHSSTITLSKADTNDQDDSDVLLASPRLLGLLQLQFPEIIEGQDLFLSAVLQKDLHPADQIIKEGTEEFSLAENMGGYYDSLFAGLGVKGAITSALHYNIFGYFQTGRTLSYIADEDAVTGYSYQYAPIIAFSGGTELTYYSPDLSYSTFNLAFVYATGDEDSISCIEGNTVGSSNLFIPISSREQRVIFNPNLSNLFYINAGYTIKPFAILGRGILEKLLIILDGTVFFRALPGKISDPQGLDPDSDSLYLGSEIDFIINFRPFSDLGASLSTGYFIPNNGPDGVFIEGVRDFEFLGKFELSFSF